MAKPWIEVGPKRTGNEIHEDHAFQSFLVDIFSSATAVGSTCRRGNGERGRRPGEVLMNSHIKSAAIALVVAILSLSMSTSAFAYSSAPLTVCNQIAFKFILAYGYHSPGVHDPADHSLLTGPFVSRGWRTVEPGECVTLENPFDARYMYWFVGLDGDPWFRDDSDVLAIRNADVPHFCIDNYMWPSGQGPIYAVPAPAFVYEDENESAAACDKDTSRFAHNLWVPAHEVDTWVNATVNYTPQMVTKP